MLYAAKAMIFAVANPEIRCAVAVNDSVDNLSTALGVKSACSSKVLCAHRRPVGRARREITRLERERDTVMLNYHEEKKRIEQKEDELRDQIEQALQIEPIMETLFTVRWELHP
jgi:uncharacterized coiled-coil DUF342 family protein